MWSCGQHSTYKGRWWRIKEKASKVFKLYIVQTCGNRIMIITNDNDNDMIIMQTCTQVDNKLGPRKVPASLRGAGGRKVFSGNHPFSPFSVSSLERCSRKMTHHLCFLIHICLCNAPALFIFSFETISVPLKCDHKPRHGIPRFPPLIGV